jgi:hypothetical protein
MLLCECDPLTLTELRTWESEEELKPNCLGVEIAPGDWRRTFEQGGWQSEDLTLLSFDPDMFNRHGSDNGRNMTPSDLALVAKTIESLKGALVVQLSTYDVNNNNGQVYVQRAIQSGLEDTGLQLVTIVRTDGKMMSLILARGCETPFVSKVAELTLQFDRWLTGLKTSQWMASRSDQRLQSPAASSRLPPLPPLPRTRRR